jgi:3-oxoacyl-[acyl-carrier-protein] synthase II
MKRVAVTGIGWVTSIGDSRESVWSAMLDGRSGIAPVTQFDASGYRSPLVAEIPEATASAGFSALERRRLSRCDRLAIRAASEALDDAGIDVAVAPHRIGVAFGAGTGDLRRNERYLADARARGIARARPSQIFNHFVSTPVDVVADRFGLRGWRSCIVAACSSSTIAIGEAAEAIRRGEIDAAVAGGSDALCRLTFSGFNALRLVDTAPCRPFARDRAGMTIGEAAAMLVLEDEASARRRGARIYAELASSAATCEAFHATAPQPDGRLLGAAIRRALDRARIDPGDVDHINAHGTGTPQNDRAESQAFRSVFGERASRIPVTSIKSMIGHCLGAAGAVEAAAAALTISRGAIPPTINHTETDPDCALDVVANTTREAPVRCAISTSLAFGGIDSVLVLRSVH